MLKQLLQKQREEFDKKFPKKEIIDSNFISSDKNPAQAYALGRIDAHNLLVSNLKFYLQTCQEEIVEAVFSEVEKEIKKAEEALNKEKNLNQKSFYEGYIKGLKFLNNK